MKDKPVCEECERPLDRDEVAISLAAYGVLFCYEHLDPDEEAVS